MLTETEVAIELANELIEIMKDREASYGSNEHRTARIMLILFPNGIVNPTYFDMIRYKFVTYIVDKTSRYVKSNDKDSAMDIAGYALRLAAFDQQIKGE